MGNGRAGNEPTAKSATAPQRRPALGDQVASRIRALIIDQTLAPGTQLPAEAELAERYGVSLRVVRDAMRQLSAEGVVERSQGRRAVVGSLEPTAISRFLRFLVRYDRRSLAHVMELRMSLEPDMAALGARRADASTRTRLRDVFEEYAGTPEGSVDRTERDLELHRVIAEASGNPLMGAFHAALVDVLRAERQTGESIRRAVGISPESALRGHAAVVEAIEAGDEEGARAAMQALLRGVWETIESQEESSS